ncbi:MAG: phage major capsid protein [Clostridia bacterium]|nr:phage major capsid protein [Clostridia bacterium]
MVSLDTAENALKTVYLGVVANQLNVGVNPLMAKIEQTTSDVWGSRIVKMVPYGLNGGVGAGSENGKLPISAGNQYGKFTLDLKNLYGTIELTDKAIRASQHNEAAFVNLLNSEMEGLLTASKYNLGRMLYGDGSGVLANVVAGTYSGNTISVTDTHDFTPGMCVSVYNGSSNTYYSGMDSVRIVDVDRVNNTITLDANMRTTYTDKDFVCVQTSYKKELTGLKAIFAQSGSLYGLNKDEYSWLKPQVRSDVGALTQNAMQSAIDGVEEKCGGNIDMIVCAYDTRRYYIDSCSANRMNIDYMNLDNGYKAISYNGIPVVADKFVRNGDMYLLNTADFKLHQLCDWRWIEGESGKVLHQVPGWSRYTATLVKYADLICDRPAGQAMLSGITSGT